MASRPYAGLGVSRTIKSNRRDGEPEREPAAERTVATELYAGHTTTSTCAVTAMKPPFIDTGEARSPGRGPGRETAVCSRHQRPRTGPGAGADTMRKPELKHRLPGRWAHHGSPAPRDTAAGSHRQPRHATTYSRVGQRLPALTSSHSTGELQQHEGAFRTSRSEQG